MKANSEYKPDQINLYYYEVKTGFITQHDAIESKQEQCESALFSIRYRWSILM